MPEVRISGAAAFSETLEDLETPRREWGTASDEGAVMMRAARMTRKDLGLGITHTKTLFVTVKADFLVSER